MSLRLSEQDLQNILKDGEYSIIGEFASGLNVKTFPARGDERRPDEPKREDTDLEAKFLSHWKLLYGIIAWERDFTDWGPESRKLEIDFYHPESRVGVEINGGTRQAKRTGHSSGNGIWRDYEKILVAAAHGIHILPVCVDMLSDTEIVITCSQIKRVIQNRTNK